MERGEVLDGCFWIERCVQRSATLEVYRAVDTRDSTPVHVRVHVDLSSTGIERLEWSCASLFAHPHPALERVVAWGTTERGARYVAIEVPNGPLLEELVADRLLDEDISRVTTRALEALGHLHTLGLCHGALSATAIVLPRGICAGATLVDVTMVPSSLIASEASYPSVQVESASHLAPERVRSSSGPSAASDIFALGCVVYRMLTGLIPFAATTVMGTYLRILYDEPAFPGARDGSGGQLDALALGMMLKNPDQRPTARDALRSLTDDARRPDVSADAEWLDAPTGANRRRDVALVLCRSVLRSTSSLDSEGDMDQVQRLVDGVAGRLDRLSDGTLLVELGQDGATATGDPLIRAGRAALMLQAALPLARFAVAFGRSPHSLDAAELLLRQVGRGKIWLAPDTVARMERQFEVEHTPEGALLWEREARTSELSPTAARAELARRRASNPSAADLEEVTLVENKRRTVELAASSTADQLEPLPTIEMDLSALARSMLPRVQQRSASVEPTDPAPAPAHEIENSDTDGGPASAADAAEDALGEDKTISQRPDQRPDRKSAS